MSITTIEQGVIHTDSLEFVKNGAMVLPGETASLQRHEEDRDSMRMLSRLLIHGTSGNRNTAEPLPAVLLDEDTPSVARRLGMTLMRQASQRVFFASLETLADQPSLVEMLVECAKKEKIDIFFLAESDQQKQDFSIIKHLVSEFPDSPIVGVNETEVRLRYLPISWQKEIEVGLQAQQAEHLSIA